MDGKQQEVRDLFDKQIKTGLPDLLEQLRLVTRAINGVQKQIGEQNRGGVDDLYIAVSDIMEVSGGRIGLAERQIIIYIVLLILSTIAVVLITMIKNGVTKKEEAAS